MNTKPLNPDNKITIVVEADYSIDKLPPQRAEIAVLDDATTAVEIAKFLHRNIGKGSHSPKLTYMVIDNKDKVVFVA